MLGEARPAALTVEPGKINEFRLATGLPLASPAVVAPVTFPAVVEHYGQAVVQALLDHGYQQPRILHAEESITYPEGPLRAHDELHGSVTVVKEEDKPGKSGPLRFVTVAIELRHPDGRLAVKVERTFVVRLGDSAATEKS